MKRRFSQHFGATPAPLLALAAALCLVGTPARAQSSYTFTDVGLDNTDAYGVNSLGQVVGYISNSTGGNAFVWLPAPAYGLPAGLTSLGNVGGSSLATGINTSGEIVGRGGGFVWLPATRYGLPAGMTDLVTVFAQFGVSGYSSADAYAINENHQITGGAVAASDNAGHGFVLDLTTGAFSDLGTAMAGAHDLTNNPAPQVIGGNYLFSFADNSLTNLSPLNGRAINDAGAIAGNIFVSPNGRYAANYHAFYRDPSGQLTDLGGLGYNASRADAINNAGVYPATVVGYTYTKSGLADAMRWRVGSAVMQDLNSLCTTSKGFRLVEATAIADGGYIVGYCVTTKAGIGVYRGFLLTPKP